MVDLAIGFTVGAAFSAIARSLVDDIVMPFVALLLGGSSINDFYILLREGSEPGPPPEFPGAPVDSSANTAVVAFGLLQARQLFTTIRY
jgi:large conductance mechanosensitive channel